MVSSVSLHNIIMFFFYIWIQSFVRDKAWKANVFSNVISWEGLMKVLIIRKGEVSQINICSAQYIKWSNPIFGLSELRALPLLQAEQIGHY